MATRKLVKQTQSAGDDNPLFIIRADTSSGMNQRTHKSQLKDTEVERFENMDLGVVGNTTKRPGITLVKNLSTGAPIDGLFFFEPVGSNAMLVEQDGTNIRTWNLSTPATFTVRKSDFTASSGTRPMMLKGYESSTGDITFIKIENNNWFRMKQDFTFQDLGSTSGTGNDSPPNSPVAAFYGNRLFILKGNLLYFSDAAPSDYSTAFDTVTNAYRINVGDERVLVPTRDYGLIVGGSRSIYTQAFASTTPAATDVPKMWLDMGVAEGKTFCQVGDDYMFLAYDGVRGLKRTVYDKVQLGNSLPVSYRLKDEFSQINWAVINKACAVYFDNKYFISLPYGSSQTNNNVWVYWPGLDAWAVITGWNVACWEVVKINGKLTLLAGEATNNGIIYQAWHGTDDNGTAITMTELSRDEDLGQPLIKKVCGEVKVSAVVSGDYNIDVSASFDDGGFNLLGSVNLADGLITFPVTFPVHFPISGISYKKFHLDGYNPWYRCQLQLTNSDVTSHEGDITVLSTEIIAYPEQYISEEDSNG